MLTRATLAEQCLSGEVPDRGRFSRTRPGRPSRTTLLALTAASTEEDRSACLAAGGRALEVNTTSPLWSVQLVRWFREEGGTAISFGSDAHLPHAVGQRFDLAVDVVEAAGFRPGRDRFDFWRR